MKKNFFYNLINQLLTLIVPLITTPYTARVLGEVVNGQISYSLSIITYFILFANLGFVIYGQREIAAFRDNRKEKSKIFWEINILKSVSTIISLIVLVIIMLAGGFGEKYNKLILIYGIQLIAVFLDLTFYYQGMENFKGLAIRSVLMKVASLVCILVFVKTPDDAWIYVLCLSLSIIFGNVIMWPSIFKQVDFVKIKELKLRKRIIPSILIFLPCLAISIYMVLDKTMIGLLSSNPDYDNGCYEQAYKINNTATIILAVISTVLTPRNTYYYSHGEIDKFKNNIYFSCNYVLLIGLPIFAGFLVLSDNLSYWFLGEGYNDVPLMLRIMSIRFIVSGLGMVFSNQIFIAIGKEKYASIATISAAIVNFVLNLLLIPKYGGIGAAVSTAICEVTVTAVLCIFVYKYKYVSLKKVVLSSFKYFVASLCMYVSICYLNFDYSVWSFLLTTLIGSITYFISLYTFKDDYFIGLLQVGFDTVYGKVKKSNINKRKNDILFLF